MNVKAWCPECKAIVGNHVVLDVKSMKIVKDVLYCPECSAYTQPMIDMSAMYAGASLDLRAYETYKAFYGDTEHDRPPMDPTTLEGYHADLTLNPTLTLEEAKDCALKLLDEVTYQRLSVMEFLLFLYWNSGRKLSVSANPAGTLDNASACGCSDESCCHE